MPPICRPVARSLIGNKKRSVASGAGGGGKSFGNSFGGAPCCKFVKGIAFFSGISPSSVSGRSSNALRRGGVSGCDSAGKTPDSCDASFSSASDSGLGLNLSFFTTLRSFFAERLFFGGCPISILVSMVSKDSKSRGR